MQTIFKICRKQAEKSAYLTIYLSLIFGIILSLLLALIEGAAIGASRLQSELVADLGIDAIFAEYNRELLEQYDVFFIDDSYGSQLGSIGNVQKHLESYMSYNMNPARDKGFHGKTSFLLLKNPYLEIEEAAFATDQNGEVWKAQAVSYMKDIYGLSLVSGITNQLQTIKGEGMMVGTVSQQIEGQCQIFEQAVEQKKKEIIERGEQPCDAVTEEGYSYDEISECWNSIKGSGVLDMLLQDSTTVSGKRIVVSEYASARAKEKRMNLGCGLPDGVTVPNEMDELLFGEYLMKKCGTFCETKKTGRLSYEVEYILYGKSSDVENLRSCAETLLTIRTAANYIYLTTKDAGKNRQAQMVASVLCMLLEVPEMTQVLTNIILGVWAYAEAVLDVRCLLHGGKLTLIKEESEWNLGLGGLLFGELYQKKIGVSSSKMTAMSYQDYLRVLLGVMNEKDKAMRSMDIVEMNLRETEGNAGFRMDQCIDYLKISFGFADTGGHEFVFSRAMRYGGL